MFCGHCGKQITNTSKFCAYCGHPTQVSQVPTPGQPNGYNPYSHQTGGYSMRTPSRAGGGILSGAGQNVARTARSVGTYKMLSIIVVLICLLLALFYNQFIKSKKPEDTIADLEKALNTLDTEAMLDCFDKQTQKLYSGSLGLAGSLLGLDVDLDDISDLASGLGGLMANTGLTPKITMQATDIDYSDNNTCMATVDVTVSYGGETESETIQLPMKKDGRKWVISLEALSEFVNF